MFTLAVMQMLNCAKEKITKTFRELETIGLIEKKRKNALQLLKEIVSDGNAEYCVDILLLSQQNGRSDAGSVRNAITL